MTGLHRVTTAAGHLFGFRFARGVGYDSDRDLIVEAGDEGGGDEAMKRARKVKRGKKLVLAWVLEPEDRLLSKMLNLDSLPRAIVVTPEGKILFGGHPNSPQLLAALKRIRVDVFLREESAS